jgi:hypothetical protein
VKQSFFTVIANTVKQSRKTMLGRHGYRLAMTANSHKLSAVIDFGSTVVILPAILLLYGHI